MLRGLFVTSGLSTGGAEKQLVRILSRLHGRDLQAGVVSLLGPGPVSAELGSLGIPVWHLGLERAARLPIALPGLLTIVRRFRPEVIQGWMYHGNLAAVLAHWWRRRARLVFGVRQSLHDIGREKPMTRRVIRWNARASRRAGAIVYNSQTARRQHEEFGFAAARGLVIDNGFDTARFRPDRSARQVVRAELGMPTDAPLIGLVARHHPMKGHEIFLQAAGRLAAGRPAVQFLLAGAGVVADRPPFSEWAHQPSLAGRLYLLGERTDMPQLTAALDIACSSSCWGEAFPNAIGEAMSCGVPCVATDVGDVRRIVGDTGIVVPAGDAAVLAAAWEHLLDMPAEERVAMGSAARARVDANFGIDSVARKYAALYSGDMDGELGSCAA